MTLEFRVLTLNAWGLALFLAPHRKLRFEAIGKFLASSGYDIICLQEVWTKSDFNSLKEALKPSHPYYHYFYSGLIGSGLCIFSKWLIEETFYYQFPMNGFFHMIHHGDWFGGKGVGLAVVSVEGLKINIYNSHLHANYGDPSEKDTYHMHRLIQCLDAALFVRHTSGAADLCVFGGDLNSTPNDLGVKVLESLAQLQDSWESADLKEVTPETNDCLRNSFRRKGLPDDFPGLRIDYVLFKSSSKIKIHVLECIFPFEKRIPGTDISYSDHEAVGVKFQFQSCGLDDDNNHMEKRCRSDLTSERKDALKISLGYCRMEVKALRKSIQFLLLRVFFLFSFLFSIPFVIQEGIFMKFAFSSFSVLIIFQFIILIARWHDLAWIKNAKKRLKIYVSNS